MGSETLTAQDLSQFTGTENWYRHNLNTDILYTDGAYWLLDEIALANAFKPEVKAEEFQLWTLTKHKTDDGATLDCGDGNGKTVYSKGIEYTDFPLATIKLYCTDGTILLPSEY